MAGYTQVDSIFKYDYETARKIIKDIDTYGCYTKDEYIEKRGVTESDFIKKSAETKEYIGHDKRRLILKNKLESDKQSSGQTTKEMIQSFFYDRYDVDHNYLAVSYKLKACGKKRNYVEKLPCENADFCKHEKCKHDPCEERKTCKDKKCENDTCLNKASCKHKICKHNPCAERKTCKYKNKRCNHKNEYSCNKGIVCMIYIFQLLGDNKPYTAGEMLEALKDTPIYTYIDEQIIKRSCTDLAKLGCIEKKHAGNKYIYQRHPCPFEDFDENELKLLYCLSDLYSVKTAFNIPAVFLNESIGEYMRSKKIDTDCNIFVYEYNFMHRIFNDAIIAELIDAIENKRLVEIIPHKVYGENVIILPFKIVSEHQYGRQFVLGADIKSGKPVSCRIDVVKKVKLMEKCDTDISEAIKYFEKSWCVSDYKSDENRISERVEIDFYIDENEKDILDALNNEKRWGEIKEFENEKGHILYTIDVNDCIEMKPWIRKFGRHAVVRKSSCHTLAEDIANEWKELLEYGYGCIPGK